MDLGLNESQKMLQQAARELLAARYPLSDIRAMEATDNGFSADLWKDMAGLGWTGLGLPAEFGGQGGSLLDLAVLYDELGRACIPMVSFASNVLAGLTIAFAGTDAQKKELLPGLTDGETRWAFALTEREYGWRPESIQLRAEPEGTDYRLTGVKSFVPYAFGADKIVVPARTGGVITLFAVDGNDPGITISRQPGWFSAPLFEIRFENVGSGQVIGSVGGGWDPLSIALDHATLVICSYISGAIQKVAEWTAEYARGRIQFGQPIGAFQRVQDRIIEIQNAADAARWTTYEAIWKLEACKPNATAAIAVAKMAASRRYMDAMEHSHHVFAGYGADRNLGLWQYTRNARTVYWQLGDPEHHRARLAEALDL